MAAMNRRPMNVAENFGELSCTECTGHGNDFELIPVVKWKLGIPVEGSLGDEFPSICNHCGVMRFFGKMTPSRKIFKILFRIDSSPHRSTCYIEIS